MPRNKRLRKIMAPPRFVGYRPYGCRKHNDLPIELMYEEYESIKLADYKLMNHEQAAELMGVSRATFARIYENARRKIAQALVETKEIITAVGHSYSDQNWHNCSICNARFTIPVNFNTTNCPMCNNSKIETIQFNTSK